MLATSALTVAGLFGAAARAEAAPPPGQVSFSAPSLSPGFGARHRGLHRSLPRPAGAAWRLHASGEWRIAIGHDQLPTRRFPRNRASELRADLHRLLVKRTGYPRASTATACDACLATSRPIASPSRASFAQPKYYSVDSLSFFIPFGERYSIIFDSHGVPIWWLHTWGPEAPGSSPEGRHPVVRPLRPEYQLGDSHASTEAWSEPCRRLVRLRTFTTSSSDEPRRLSARRLRSRQSRVDTSPYGGSGGRRRHEHRAAADQPRR